MKKLFALALVVLGLAACQTDFSDLDVQLDGEATICLTIPEDVATRATVTNNDSADSGLANIDGKVVRFILAVYDETGKEKIRETQYAEQGILTANFPVRLVPGRSYTFVAWADMVDAVDAGDKHYNTEYLTNITIKDEWNAMDETRDAFTASKTITSYSSTADLDMQLTRPFAKIRVITTDVADLKSLGLEVKKASVEYTTKIPVSYNAFEQKVATIDNKTHEKYEIATYTANDNETTKVLYTDYIFANDEQGAVKFSLTTYDQNDTKIKQVDFNTDIPVKRNMLTTLTGNVMTEGNNVNVEVKPVFPEEGGKHDITAISSYQDLLTAIGNGGEYLVINDIAINLAGASNSSFVATRTGEEATEETTPAAGKSTTINLNGFTITVKNTSTEAAIIIPAGNTLVITGNGDIELTADSTNAVFNNNEGQVIIAGGKLEDNATDTNANIFTKEENVKNIVAELKAAFAGELELENNTYTLEADVTLSETLTLAAGKTLVLNLNGKTLAGISSTTGKNYDFIDVRGTLNVENGTITAIFKGENMGWSNSTNVFNITAGGVVNLNGVTATNLGGSDMAFVAHLNNWGTATFNAVNSTLESTYIAVRVFNSGPDMNNVTITNSTLKGKYCFWVHNYNPSGDTCGNGGGTDATLKIDIYNGTNRFEYTGKAPILYGFNTPFYLDANGNRTIADGVAISLAGDYYISNAVGLKWVAENVNTMEYYVSESANIFDGKTVYLANDIDLGGAEWRPIGDYAFSRTSFNGVFDGQNYTVSNFKVTNKVVWTEKVTEASYGFFGNVKGTIKNLIIENATINPEGGRYTAALVGRLHNGGAIENCHVVNSAVTISHWQVGGIVGQNNNGNISDSSVTNSTITGMAAVGAIVGMDMVKGEHQVTNCQVKNTHLVQNASFGESYDATYGLIVGLANQSGIILNLNNITVENNTIKGETSDTLVGDKVNGVVIKIDGKSAEEIAFAETLAKGGKVTLSTDMTLNAAIELENTEVVLDLNGKTITSIAENGYVFENKGNLTITGNGTINGVVYTEGSGNTIIENGTYNALENGKYVFLNSEGTLTINGGTINGGSSYPIYSYNANNKLVINDVTVNATFGCVNAYGLGGEVTINGGTYQMTGVQGKTSHIAYFSNVDATINGGTFKKIGDISMSGTGGGGICAIYGAKLTINGGTFAGDYADVYNCGGTNANNRAVAISIKGGTYKFKPSFVAEGMTATENADGSWKVE